MHETEDAVLAKDRKIKELMDAIEELEQEKRTEILSIETQRQVEKATTAAERADRAGRMQVSERAASATRLCVHNGKKHAVQHKHGARSQTGNF